MVLEGDACRQVFDNPKAEQIACQTGFRLDPATRSRLESNSFGFVSDLACSAVITAKRSEVVARLHAKGDAEKRTVSSLLNPRRGRPLPEKR